LLKVVVLVSRFGIKDGYVLHSCSRWDLLSEISEIVRDLWGWSPEYLQGYNYDSLYESLVELSREENPDLDFDFLSGSLGLSLGIFADQLEKPTQLRVSNARPPLKYPTNRIRHPWKVPDD
jgi:hypothetical protein